MGSSIVAMCPDLSWAKAAPKELLDHLRRDNVDMLLKFDEQHQIPVHRLLLCLSSPVLADMLQFKTDAVLSVGEDAPENWLHVLEHLYPLHPIMNSDTVVKALSVAHKYNMPGPLAACTEWIMRLTFDAAPNSPLYALRWLEVSERFGLGAVTDKAIRFVTDEVEDGRRSILADKAGLSTVSAASLAEVLSAVHRLWCGPAFACSRCDLQIVTRTSKNVKNEYCPIYGCSGTLNRAT